MTPERSRLAAVAKALKLVGLFVAMFGLLIILFHFPWRGEPPSSWPVTLLGSAVIAAVGVGALIAGFRPKRSPWLSKWLDGDPGGQ